MNDKIYTQTAVLYSNTPPSDEQEKKFIDFLKQRYNEDISLVWKKTDIPEGGFKLEIGSEVFDWSIDGRLAQFKEALSKLKNKSNDIIPLIRETVENWTPEAIAEEIGEVLTVGDGIATVSGLKNATYGEILLFTSGVRGMVQDLRDGEIGCILFGSDEEISEGSTVKRTGKTAGVPVGDEFIGRVVNALGVPIDGQGEIHSVDYRAVENPAPGIIDRQPVCTPMETGILTIDSMFPIGRGQRELIIGDRQTGKTAIAIDTILNQKGKDVICIYVAIGQKASSVAQLVQNLKSRGAMEYTIIVNASASDSAPLQYIAPYAGCALGEYFMDNGKDVLIVYDDLSKHAIAYRSLSLLLERAPGREAYPGDVFYLHSRLLERSAHLSDEKGGGSMTALPIVETQSGDVSAYIPTNIISITDGQIYLETEMFNAGFRPAVNAGLSVSRVGGSAQIKAMKKIAAPIRVELAQYRELAAFAQFGSELDADTKQKLDQGERIKEVLKQDQYQPMPVEDQIIMIYTVTRKYLLDVPVKRVQEFEKGFLEFVKTQYADIPESIRETKVMSDECEARLVEAIEAFKKNF